MFGFGYRAQAARYAKRLGEVLEHVGVHPAELVAVEGGVSAFMTAENVLLRQAEEIEVYRQMLVDDGETDETELEVARRNLAYERQGRSVDRIAYADALRAAGREKGALSLCHDKAHRELNAIFDALVARNLSLPVDDGVEVNLPLLVELALDKTIVPFQAEPLLGLATTRELLDELTARAELNGQADYRTAEDPRVAPGQEAEGFAVTCARGRAVEPSRD